MNTNYIYYNGKATILDSTGNEKEIDYYDKLEEVLERENIIEVLENKRKILINAIKQINRDYKKSNKEYRNAILWFLFPLTIFCLNLIIVYFFGNSYIDTSIGTFSCGVFESIITSLLTTPVAVILANANYKYRKTLQDNIHQKEKDIEKIEKQITLQKNELEELKKDKTNSIEDNYYVARLNKMPDFYTIRNMELERLFDLLNQDLILEDDEKEIEEKPSILKKKLR